MTSQPAKLRRLRKLTLAAVAGVIAGVAREITAWALHNLLNS